MRVMNTGPQSWGFRCSYSRTFLFFLCITYITAYLISLRHVECNLRVLVCPIAKIVWWHRFCSYTQNTLRICIKLNLILNLNIVSRQSETILRPKMVASYITDKYFCVKALFLLRGATFVLF